MSTAVPNLGRPERKPLTDDEPAPTDRLALGLSQGLMAADTAPVGQSALIKRSAQSTQHSYRWAAIFGVPLTIERSHPNATD
jgi:hypothetical protein